MRFSPAAGSILFPLGASSLPFHPSDPSPAWDRIAATTLTANRLASDGSSRHPASAIGRQGLKSSTSARPNWSDAVITPLHAATIDGPNIRIHPTPASMARAVANSRLLRTSPLSAASFSRLPDGASVFSPPASDISRARAYRRRPGSPARSRP